MATRRKLKWTEFVPLFLAKEERKPEDTFIICVNRQELSKERLDELIGQCNAHLQCESTLSWGSCYAGDVFELQWQHKDLAYPVMDFLLRNGLKLFTQTRMCVNIDPLDLKPGETCTPEWLERTIATTTRSEIERATAEGLVKDRWRAVDNVCGYYSYVYSHEASWLTEEGRALVRWIVAQNKLNADSSDEEVAVATPLAVKPPVAEEEDAVAEPPAKKPRLDHEDEDNECVICMDKKPDTLVLPCMNCVVCRACSEQLKTTGDARVCVKCRRPIDSVEQDAC
jgi:hypothetical protein